MYGEKTKITEIKIFPLKTLRQGLNIHCNSNQEQ